MIPTVLNISKAGKEATDILSYCFSKKREIFLFEEIPDSVSAEVVAQLEYLKDISSDNITIYINSPGGSVTAGFAIADAINRAKNKCKVSIICTGIAASMGAFILSCGTNGLRYVTPLSEVMIHQPLGGTQGQASDILITAKHIKKTKDKINKILSENTGKSIKTIAKDCDRDYFMDAKEAIKYGIADKILE